MFVKCAIEATTPLAPVAVRVRFWITKRPKNAPMGRSRHASSLQVPWRLRNRSRHALDVQVQCILCFITLRLVCDKHVSELQVGKPCVSKAINEKARASPIV
eukprot:6190369-Pleurochrysis_carterae.AAC.7